MYEDVEKVCLYVRYSSDKQTEQSIEGQLTICKDFCERNGFHITQIYADRATSASKNTYKRTQFLQMIKDSEKHPFDAVVVYKLDRFSRSRYDMATYKYRLKRNGVQLISATENISNSPEGIILESVLEGMAEFYSAELAQKVKRGMSESAKKHNSTGGQVPLGYKVVDKKLVIDENTAHIVRTAFQMFADGEKIATICNYFNERGYRTSKNAKFSRSSFHAMFSNVKYIGTYKYDNYTSENSIPAIIDKPLWDKVQKRVLARSQGKREVRKGSENKYLLSGKLFCGECGAHMWGNSAGRYPYYRCSNTIDNRGCHKASVRVEWIEDLVVRDAMSFFTDDVIDKVAGVAIEYNDVLNSRNSEIPSLNKRLSDIESSLANLLNAIESGDAPSILVKRMTELEREKKEVLQQISEERQTTVTLRKEMIIYWLEQFKHGDVNDIAFRKKLIDLLVNSVTVYNPVDGKTKVTIGYNLEEYQHTYKVSKDNDFSLDFTDQCSAVQLNTQKRLVYHHLFTNQLVYQRKKCLSTANAVY